MRLTYLDNAATVFPCQAAVNAFNDTLAYANPSSGHSMGLEARELLERARADVANAMNAQADEIVFTSGGTEANALVLNGRGRVVSSVLEHSSVWENADERVPVSKLGEAMSGAGIVSCVFVCNENGAVQPIADIAREARKQGVLFHTDAVQAFGKLDCDVKKLGVDLMTVSAHKIGGIRGVGALYVRGGVKLKPLWRGGGQERGLRNGTEALPLIAAFAAAVKAPKSDTRPLLEYTLDLLRRELPDVLPVPPLEAPHILMLALPGCPGQVVVRMLSDLGVCVSTGSACSRGKTSRVLKALNFKHADSVIRVSFGSENTREDADRLIETLALVKSRFDKPVP